MENKENDQADSALLKIKTDSSQMQLGMLAFNLQSKSSVIVVSWA